MSGHFSPLWWRILYDSIFPTQYYVWLTRWWFWLEFVSFAELVLSPKANGFGSVHQHIFGNIISSVTYVMNEVYMRSKKCVNILCVCNDFRAWVVSITLYVTNAARKTAPWEVAKNLWMGLYLEYVWITYLNKYAAVN